MKAKKDEKNKKSDKGRFDKIVNHITQKSSPSSEENEMSVEDEADAEGGEGKPVKLRRVDLSPKNFR